MGINHLLKLLPGGAMSDTRCGFAKLKILQDKSNPADLDTGTLIFVCALRHKRAFQNGDYAPAVAEFQRQLILMKKIYKWEFVCIFDGRPPPEKQHEHRRRRERDDDGIVVDSTFIKMCANICKHERLPYIVAPAEADMQVGRRSRTRGKVTVVICRDGDEVAYGNTVTVLIDSWFKEECRVITMNTPVTPEIAEKYPLYTYYCKYGIRVIRWWAAVMGCDVSENACGIRDAGEGAFFKALQSFDGEDPSEVTAASFAKELRANSRTSMQLSYSVRKICAELERVSQWFASDGTFYDEDGNVLSVAGHVVKGATKSTVGHMKGDLDPKSGLPFTSEQKRKISAAQPHNLLHNSAADRSTINGVCLPEGRASVAACTNAELKAMIIARGGNLTGRDGKALARKELVRVLQAYLLLEAESPLHTVYFDRSRSKNGIFANIDTSERRSVPQILGDLVKSGEHEEPLRKFFAEVQTLHRENKFEDNFATIALTAPELTQDFIRNAFIHVGDSTSQKNIASGLAKVLEMDEILYHAFAWGPDNKSIYIISKQRASQKRDEKTRNKTPNGEKPKPAEYLVLLQASVTPTTVESHGHALGKVVHVMRTYCAACKCGLGMCNHRSGGFWMQHLHWGEDRPTPKPATTGYCSWIPGMRAKRTCSTREPATHTHIEKLPTSNEEAQQKLERGVQKNMHQGVAASYDVYGGSSNKWGRLNNPRYGSVDRIRKLFDCLKEAQSEETDN